MKFLPIYTLILLLVFSACNDEANKSGDKNNNTMIIHSEPVSYKIDSVQMQGYLAYDSSITGKRPAILVVPEWWGLNEYAKRRARELAELGYIAMAVDMYGAGKTADNPTLAQEYATPFYKNAEMAKSRMMAAMEVLAKNPLADTSQMGAIGYCFGGSMVLNLAKMGADLRGVVSFHGDLNGVPANKELLKSKILVLHGADDKFVPEATVASFKKQMDSIKADYRFVAYEGATHAFTNPDATAMGKKFSIPVAYNAAADTASWKEMKVFFTSIFEK